MRRTKPVYPYLQPQQQQPQPAGLLAELSAAKRAAGAAQAETAGVRTQFGGVQAELSAVRQQLEAANAMAAAKQLQLDEHDRAAEKRLRALKDAVEAAFKAYGASMHDALDEVNTSSEGTPTE